MATELLRRDQPFVLRQSRPDLADDAAFLAFRQEHADLRIESDEEGTLTIMSPSGWRSANRNAHITAQLLAWAQRDGTGEVSDSSGLFRLRGNARRAPDAAWTRRDRLAQVSPEQQEGILPIAPDVVIELRSPTDQAASLLAKMDEYLAAGVCLGWLIDPVEQRTYELRPGQAVVVQRAPRLLRGDPELPGLVLDLDPIW